MDRVAMTFVKIEVEYKESKANGTAGGSIKGGWDVKRTKAL
jgi:hypothetical protein